jgi:hypothetical protein
MAPGSVSKVLIGVVSVLALGVLAGWLIASQRSSSEVTAGYELGVAGTPSGTGMVREFALVAREAPWEIAPGVTVPARARVVRPDRQSGASPADQHLEPRAPDAPARARLHRRGQGR